MHILPSFIKISYEYDLVKRVPSVIFLNCITYHNIQQHIWREKYSIIIFTEIKVNNNRLSTYRQILIHLMGEWCYFVLEHNRGPFTLVIGYLAVCTFYYSSGGYSLLALVKGTSEISNSVDFTPWMSIGVNNVGTNFVRYERTMYRWRWNLDWLHKIVETHWF